MTSRSTRAPFALFAALALTLLAAATSFAQDKIPTQVTERLWLDPGPKQDGPGAPKLLLVYPIDRTHLGYGEPATRYAGRVEPPGATVLLDGKPVTVYPGGVFTGLIAAPVGERKVAFRATEGGKSTVIKRTVIRGAKAEPPRAWPLSFNSGPSVSPSGDYWLREGSRLEVKLFASPGASAKMRVGSDGAWIAMKPAIAVPSQGGAYSAEIEFNNSIPSGEAQKVEFKLTGSPPGGGAARTITKVSSLRLRRLPEEMEVVGRINKDFATFLKYGDGWERHGNWILGSPFPVIERRGERFKTSFGAGESGYIEADYCEIVSPAGAAPRPKLAAPEIKFEGSAAAERVAIEWDTPAPIAHVVHDEGDDESGTVVVNLIGAASAVAATIASPQGRGLASAQVFDAQAGQPPRLEIKRQGRELWGYEWTVPRPGRLRFAARVRPTPRSASKEKPLGGLRIMVDAGHGGNDTGAIGPSGLNEKDLNLVFAGFLGERLRALGAEVRQARSSDKRVELDARVQDALSFGADLFISVHHNSLAMSVNPLRDSGPIMYYHYPHAEPLADAMSGELTEAFSIDREPKTLRENFRVNRNLSSCPSVLIEGGFVCNPEDEIKLRATSTIKSMAEAAARGIVKTATGKN